MCACSGRGGIARHAIGAAGRYCGSSIVVYAKRCRGGVRGRVSRSGRGEASRRARRDKKKKKKTTYGTGAGYNVTGRAFAMSVAVLPLSARHTMSFAPTLCADRTADDAVASTDGIGIGWWSMRFLYVA